MKKIAIVGGGISGLTMARLLSGHAEVHVFEREGKPGGLIRCERVAGSLFHICGGHVFNTKNKTINGWFWDIFDKENDFLKADRYSAVCLPDGKFVDYPIENHVYQLDSHIQERFYCDVAAMMNDRGAAPKNFDEFLVKRFGRTLYDLYFRPYNVKVWRQDLKEIPLSWLEGKLPMPTPEQMLEANKTHLKEKDFVHSTFYYAKNNGSQFIADTLAKGLIVHYGEDIKGIDLYDGGISLRFGSGGVEAFDYLVYSGNIKDMAGLLTVDRLGNLVDKIGAFKYHGTTAVFCETESIPYSWFYQPSSAHRSHRFICTGNFSPANNAPGKMTCTVEFTDEISEAEIRQQLAFMPFKPRYLTHHYSRYSYPIQSVDTREVIQAAKDRLKKFNVKLVGRFAEWEYYNMDAAIESAMRTSREILEEL